MAVARKEEIEKAMYLSGIIEDVDGGTFPRNSDNEFDEEGPTWFDENNYEHLRAFYQRVMDCGLSYRVTMGMAVLCDPRNAVIDPELSHLELHPRLREGLEAAQSPILFWCKRVLRGAMDILKEGWNL